MSTAELKYQIISSITEIEDESILDKLKKYIATINKKNNVIGFDANKNPITAENIIDAHTMAIERISKGIFTSNDEALKQANNW